MIWTRNHSLLEADSWDRLADEWRRVEDFACAAVCERRAAALRFQAFRRPVLARVWGRCL
jgi:hypothetical protein